MTTVAGGAGRVTDLGRISARRTKIGLVAGGLGAYWPQFPELLPQLQASARRVSQRLQALDCERPNSCASPAATSSSASSPPT
jgi:hypothetical protein